MHHSVLLLSRYERKGPSSRVRHINFIPALESAGFEITIAPLLNDAYLDRLYGGGRRDFRFLIKAYGRRLQRMLSARQFDLIWIEKEALPWVPTAIERLFFNSRPVVVDFDDPWYLRYSSHPNGAIRVAMGHKLERLARKATVVTSGSKHLSNWLKLAQCSCVVEIPSAVDVDRYRQQPLPDGPFTIGWIGTPGNERYLDLIAEPLRVLCEQWGARVRMIGGGRGFSLPGVNIDYVPWQEHTEADELARCHLGVMPLVDGPWERGKCGYKLIQYMAAGRAAVASAVGPAPSIMVSGQTGLLANSTEEWISALAGLAQNREQARAMGLAARQRAVVSYSLQANAPKLIAVFKEALARKVV